MCHNTIGGTQNNLTELPGWQQIDNPLLDFTDGNIETGGDDTALVQAAIKFNDDLLGAVVVDDLEFANVSMDLHTLQELDNDLTAGSDQNLTLSSLFSVGDCLETIG